LIPADGSVCHGNEDEKQQSGDEKGEKLTLPMVVSFKRSCGRGEERRGGDACSS